jgi:uncharacterized protein
MGSIDTVLLKVASRCNLDCSYCYVYHMADDGWRAQPKLLPPEIEDAVVDQLAELARFQVRPFSVVFHGGEPLLLGTRRLSRIFDRLRSSLPMTCGLHLQTNGVLLTQAVIDACAAHQVGISISLDGDPETHNFFRVDRRGRGSHARVIAGIERLLAHPMGSALFSGILAVIDPHTDPAKIYHWLKSTAAPSIDFLYRDGNHSQLPYGKSTVGSVEYGRWMSRMLDLYLADEMPPRIRVLDDLLKLILGGAGRKEGVGLTDFGIVVIETDGTINKNDTLKSTFGAADKFERGWSILRHRLADVVVSTEFESYHRAQRPSSPICLNCGELAICGGGMPAHRWSAEKGFNNPSVFCADQQYLIRRMREWIVR